MPGHVVPAENIFLIQSYLCECMGEGMKTMIKEKQNIVTRIIVVLCKEMIIAIGRVFSIHQNIGTHNKIDRTVTQPI